MNQHLRRFSLCIAALIFAPLAFAQEQIWITVPPPGSLTPLTSAEVQGVVVGLPGPAPMAEIFVRTRYQDGTNCAPITRDGSYVDGALGWSYPVEWDELTGVGTFTGRAKWFRTGTNYIDLYAPTDTLGAPCYSQSIIYQIASTTPTDVVVGVHPFQRNVDLLDVSGSAGQVEFSLDIINTTLTQVYNVDVEASITLPDNSVIDLPMGPVGQDSVSYSVAPGDFSFTSVLDPSGMSFSFPLDQPPFPQPAPEGAYVMEVRVYDGPALMYFSEGVGFWVQDRAAKPFRDVTVSAGLDEVCLQGGGRPAAGNSIAVFDYDGDGLSDLFFSNPSSNQTFLPIGNNWPYPGGRNFLMKNNGDATFMDVSATAGVEGISDVASYGVTWGDVNNDGFNDFIVANRKHQPYVYHNNGDGTFTDLAETSFGGPTNDWDMAPRLGDYDDDGDLDLYIGTYIKAWSSTWAVTNYQNRLYRNELVEGNLDPFVDPGVTFPLFPEVGPISGVYLPGATLEVFFTDHDRDGKLDIAVNNDFGGMSVGNHIFRGLGNGTFNDVTFSGFDVREFSMGVVSADLNGDTHPDVYSSSMGRNSLLINRGDAWMDQSIIGSGAEGDFVTGPQSDTYSLDNNWGVVAFDYDKDMDLDLYVAGSYLFTGYNMPLVDLNPDSVYQNDGNASFTQVNESLGLANTAQGRGVALIDYDNDGDQDILTSNENEGVTLMRNDLVTTNHHVQVRPVTRRSSPGGFNTILTVNAGGTILKHELTAESAHGGQLDNDFWFGIGANTTAEVEASWTRGGTTTHFSVSPDQETLIYEAVLEVNGDIEGSAGAGTFPTIKFYGEPNSFVIGVVGNPFIPGPFPLPGGGQLDIRPIGELNYATVLSPAGVGNWPLGTMPASLTGQTFDLQMVHLDIPTITVPYKSGVSTLTITP